MTSGFDTGRWRGAISAIATIALCLGAAAPALAAVEIRGTTLVVTTPELEINFNGWNIQSLRNLTTDEIYIAQAGPGWLDLNLKDPTSTQLTAGRWQIVADATGAQVGAITASDSVRSARLVVGTSPSGEVFFRMEGESNRPGMRSIFWGLQGFNPSGGRFIVPGQAGIYFDSRTTPARIGLEYPTHWEAQFVQYQRASGGLLIYARDPKPYFKRTIASRELGTLDVGFEVFTVAPWRTATQAPAVEWRLKAYRGDWRVGVDHYKEWSRTAWPEREPSGGRDWVRSIGSVVRIPLPETQYLDALASRVIPSKTLVYLVNWREDTYDENYPDYTPAAETAGFMARARQMGFRVMLHMNALGVAQYHRVYGRLAQYQLRDPDTEEPLFWPWGLWPDGPPPADYLPSFAFISPASSEYRAEFLAAAGPAIRTLRPDAVHLDAGGVMLNDGNGLIEGMTSIEGMMRLTQDVTRAFPEIVLSYESMTEALAPFFGFAQRWASGFPAHPIGTYLLGDRVKWYGFLDQPNPEHPEFIQYMDRYEAQGIMPSLELLRAGDLDPASEVTHRILRMMRLWQEHDLRPDWDGDWNGLRFRFASPDGRHVARIEDGDNYVRLMVDNEVVYERVRHSTAVTTGASIRGWTAYDGNALYGLDPNREYWLDSRPWPANQIHLLQVDSSVVLSSSSFATRDYAYFGLERVPPESFDFTQAFSGARLGTIYNGTEYPLGFGAFAMQTRSLIGGDLKTPVVLMQPPSRLSGAVIYIEFHVPIAGPEFPDPILTFAAGMSDFATRTDGALFVVRVNGTEVWRTEITSRGLVPAEIDLSRWAGQTVRIRFIVHPGMRLNAGSDLACWTDLQIKFRSQRGSTRFRIALPADASDVSIAGTATEEGSSGNERVARSELPAKFAVFSRAMPMVGPGESLLDRSPAVWRAGYDGSPILSRYETSGQVGRIPSRGEVLRALATVPPDDGKTIATYGVRLSGGTSRLRFVVGLADPSAPVPIIYSQAKVAVRVNGETVWDDVLRTSGWVPGIADLSDWRDRDVIIELEADSDKSGLFDWVHWAELIIE